MSDIANRFKKLLDEESKKESKSSNKWSTKDESKDESTNKMCNIMECCGVSEDRVDELLNTAFKLVKESKSWEDVFSKIRKLPITSKDEWLALGVVLGRRIESLQSDSNAMNTIDSLIDKIKKILDS